MFAILRGANGRRHEVDFGDDPVTVDVAMSPATVQVTMTAVDPGDPARCALSRLPFRAICLPQPWPLLLHVPWHTTNSDCGSSEKTDCETARMPGLLRLFRISDL